MEQRANGALAIVQHPASPELLSIERHSVDLESEVRSLSVVDQASFQRATELMNTVKAIGREIDSAFDPIIKAQHEAHKKAVATKKRYLEPLTRAEAAVKERLKAYYSAQQAGQKVATGAQTEELRGSAERRLIQRAFEAERNGDVEQARQILDSRVMVPLVSAGGDSFDGVDFRDTWKYEVVDERAVPDKYKTVNLKLIGQVVRALKDKAQIPGIRVFCEKTVAARRA